MPKMYMYTCSKCGAVVNTPYEIKGEVKCKSCSGTKVTEAPRDNNLGDLLLEG